jgi:hypothetical protein
MAGLLRFDNPMEELASFVENTAPDKIVAETWERLSNGEPKEQLLAAAALAVSRSTELPPSHHGGPVHPVSGVYAIDALSQRNTGTRGFFPVIQSVALANKHIHSPSMGPGMLLHFEATGFEGMSAESLLEGFRKALEQRMATLAEKYLVSLLKKATPGQIMDALLEVAIPRNALDDHYFLYTVFAFRAAEVIGWQYAEALLRPPVRFLCRHPKLEHAGGERGEIIEEGIALYKRFADFEKLIVDRGLDAADISVQSSERETQEIAKLASEVESIASIADIVESVADKLVGGLSMLGTLEGLSLGGARRYLRSNTGNPFDVHLHTGINARRYLLSLKGLSRRTHLLTLLSWGQGYEIRHLDRTLKWDLVVSPSSVDFPEEGSQEMIIDSIAESLDGQPGFDLTTLEGSIAELRAPESVLHVTAMAESYLADGYDPQALFRFLAFEVCRDDQSEMHAYKMQQAAYEEYTHTRETLRDAHLLAAVKHAATVSRLGPRTVYPEVVSMLETASL